MSSQTRRPYPERFVLKRTELLRFGTAEGYGAPYRVSKLCKTPTRSESPFPPLKNIFKTPFLLRVSNKHRRPAAGVDISPAQGQADSPPTPHPTHIPRLCANPLIHNPLRECPNKYPLPGLYGVENNKPKQILE